MTENERLGQVVVKRAAAVCSGKKLCEKGEGGRSESLAGGRGWRNALHLSFHVAWVVCV